MRFSPLFFGIISFVLISLSGCDSPAVVSISEDHFTGDRPHDPWVFRSVLDVKARMLTIALHDNMWIAYDANEGVFYKAWKGGVNFDGAVYTTSHGPQPVSIGDGWFMNEVSSPWEISEGGSTQSGKAKYLGHRFSNGKVRLMYELSTASGKKFKIEEEPEYFEVENKYPGLQRTFYADNFPDGVKVNFKGNAGSLASKGMVKADNAEVTFSKVEEQVRGERKCEKVEFSVPIASGGSTVLKCQFIDKPMVENPNKPEWETEENSTVPPGYKLIAKSDCKTCHNTHRKTIGPAYVDVAKKYKNTPENRTMLAIKVKNGGTGVWGSQVMNAHPNTTMADIETMVEYVMSLDADEEQNSPEGAVAETVKSLNPNFEGEEDKLVPGLAYKAMTFGYDLRKVADIKPAKAKQSYSGILRNVNIEGGDFKNLESNFAFQFRGYLNVPEDGKYTIYLASDDGSQLYLNDQLVIDHDGMHGAEAKDAKLDLKAGYYPLKLDFFQGYGGKAVHLAWSKGTSSAWEIIPSSAFLHEASNRFNTGGKTLALDTQRKIPGDQNSLEEVHPAYDLAQARPDLFTPKVGGMDFLSDGRLVVSTWDPAGSVFILENVNSGDPSIIKEKVIAKGLAEPLGLKVVDDTIFVLQKQELTKLIDHNGDDIIDEYQTLANDWRVSANFHEFAFGLAYQDGHFYGTLATAINPGGASTQPQIPDRGKGLKISRKDGSVEFIAHGLRTPNGIGIGYEDQLFVCDNQGDWLPSSKMVHLRPGSWYGSRSVDFEGTANLKETPPVIWMPQDEIGNSPSTPLALNDGPYKNQMIYSEVTHGGIKRVFVERVKGELQGCLFRFIQGLESGVNRMVWGPDGALYVGGIGSTGNWGQTNKLWYGLQRLKYNGNSAFEMLAVRAKSNGIEIEFTEPLRPGEGWNKSTYNIKQWYYKPTPEYGGPKMDERKLNIVSVNVSEDRTKVFLELNGMKEGHVVYAHIAEPLMSQNGKGLWTTEAWYTMNAIPANSPGFSSSAPTAAAVNTLSEWEKNNGWKLLFDGKTTEGWTAYKSDKIGSSWVIDDGALHLKTETKADGTWEVKDGGDILTAGEYENYEFSVEWKIQPCGNSGIIYNVHQSDEYGAVWQTGPEMQVLDNTCHPDARFPTHRAGDLYDMIECKYETVLPAGQWNHARVIINNGHLQHWLNGHKVVETQMWDANWEAMVAKSKFKDMPGFGKYKKGHISLQDHSDKVWFRNIKIRELGPNT